MKKTIIFKLLLSSILLLSISISMSGCGGCKEQSIKDAREMSKQYETRIQVYEVLFAPPGYHSHAEAQVNTPSGWKFYRGGKIEDKPEKIRKVKNTCFTLQEFERLTSDSNGTFYWKENCGDKWPEPTLIDRIPAWVLLLLVII